MTSPATVTICGVKLPVTLNVDQYHQALEPTTGRDAIYSAIARGEIPHIRRGRCIRILTVPAARALGLEVAVGGEAASL